MPNREKKKTTWKALIENASPKKRKDILKNPQKYLIFVDEEYSPEYIRQLKYRLNKKYNNNK